MQNIARQRDGKCLSKEYADNKTKLRWQCKQGHEWEASPSNIKKGGWCRICSKKAKYTIQEMRDLARKRGGKCLSRTYKGVFTKLEWQCEKGHRWKAIPTNINRGTWCPQCRIKSIGEEICRNYFQTIFNKQFPSIQPQWLGTGKGCRQLDGYCEQLKLAFEYNGRQHYTRAMFFAVTPKQQKRIDLWKKKKCEQERVTLITIPHIIPFEQMQECIINKCKEAKIKMPQNIKKIDYKEFNIYSDTKLQEMKEIAKQRKGECTSTEYINDLHNLDWRCQKNHEWKARPSSVKAGTWCLACAREQRTKRTFRT